MSLPFFLGTLHEHHPTQFISVHGKIWQIRDTASKKIATDVPPLVLLPGALGTGDVFHHRRDGDCHCDFVWPHIVLGFIKN